MTSRLLQGWKADETPRATARVLMARISWPLRNVIVGYVKNEPQAAIKRLAMLSDDVREIIDGGGERWLKLVFNKMELI